MALKSKYKLGKVLGGLGVLGPAFRLNEMLKAERFARPPQAAPDGLPFPERLLMVRVAGHADADLFFQTGLADADFLSEVAAQSGVPLTGPQVVLDWGCGCGRVARHIAVREGVKLIGVDVDGLGPAWCKRHLPGDYSRCGLLPPFDLAAASVDIAYGLSVLTHLTRDVQKAWLTELARVIRPGGLAMLTYHDEIHPNLEAHPDCKRQVEAEGFGVTSKSLEGTNYTATFQTRDQIAAAADDFESIASFAWSQTPMAQALIVLRRR